MHEIYEPAEDSYLLADTLKKAFSGRNFKKPIKKIKFLEIGCGKGIQLQTLRSIGAENILGADINPKAVDYCRAMGFKCILSDIFNEIKNQKFDVIIFNAPYLPEDLREPEKSKPATTGGARGSEIINRFLKQAPKYLENNGKIFLVFSSLTKGIKWQGFKKKILADKKVFFEEIYVAELTF